MVNDADSYRRYLKGDDQGLVEIIERYHYGLTLFINTMVNNICLAEELTEECFFIIAINKPSYKDSGHFKTWLYSIAKHCTVDYIRHNSKVTYVPTDEALQLSDEVDIERNYIKEEQKAELHRALKKLRPEYRQVLYLVFFENFSTMEIGKIMKKNKKQIGNLLYRAKAALKSELERGGFEYVGY